MKPHLTLRQLFNPVQPRFKEGGDHVMYQETAPDRLLSEYISCYWQLASVKPLMSPFQYTVIADGCIDFFFNLGKEHENYVMGFSSTYTSFDLPTTFNYAGVRFLPGAFSKIYNFNAAELTNQCHYIDDVLSKKVKLATWTLSSESRLEDFRQHFNDYFKKLIYNNKVPADLRFEHSLRILLASEGNVRIEKNLQTEISPRQLRRLFNFYIGASPKEFAKVARFQKFVSTTKDIHSLRNERLYYSMGYYDQSHFIKDFNTLYGTSPLKGMSI